MIEHLPCRSVVKSYRGLCESNPVYIHLWAGSSIEQNMRSEKMIVIIITSISIIYGRKWIQVISAVNFMRYPQPIHYSQHCSRVFSSL